MKANFKDRKPKDNHCIDRRRFLKTGALAAAGAAAHLTGAGRFAQAGEPENPPNILYVFSDEHRWCSLSFTEMPELQTPNFERLADQGGSLDNCISTSPICVPHRGMLMTGMWPHQSGIQSNGYHPGRTNLGRSLPTIAQTFNRAGYATGYIGKWHLGESTTREAGFDYFKHWLWGDNHWKTKVRDGNEQGEWDLYTNYNATGMTDQAIEFMRDRAGGENPFLLMLSWNPPHHRMWDAPEDYMDLYPGDTLSFRPNNPRSDVNETYRGYHAHISAIDHEMGRLMKESEELGIAKDTLVIYTSDHGTGLGENGIGSKPHPHDEVIRVPFIARWPGHIPQGRRTTSLLGSIDLFPTLCGLAGIGVPSHCGGQDLSHLLRGESGPRPEFKLIESNSFSRNYFDSRIKPDVPHDRPPFRGVRTERYTFAVSARSDMVLFDNREDPYQMNNLVDDPAHADLKERLRGLLMDRLAVAEDPYIPKEWREVPLPERIARQNERYSVEPRAGQLQRYRDSDLEHYLAAAEDEGQKQQLRVAAEEVYDYHFFGKVLALERAIDLAEKGWKYKGRLTELKEDLQTHKEKHRRQLTRRAEKILGRTISGQE